MSRKIGLLAFMIAGAGLSFWLGREPFRHWQERRLVEKARDFLAKGDLRSAYLSSQEALLKNPRSIAACTVAVQIAELERSPAALLWRQQLADLQPGKPGPLIELAATATRSGETFIAEHALAEIHGADRDTTGYLQVSAGLAIALKQHGVAEASFQKALELEPANESLQLNLATVRLALARPEQVEKARVVLESLRAKPLLRADALRAMIGDARMQGDSVRALQLTGELRRDPHATLGDQLLFLDELHHAQSGELIPELAKLQSGAETRPEIIYALMTWMNARDLARQSTAWCEKLPAKIRVQMPVPLAEAEARTALGDWRQLREITRDADWGDLDFLRLAIQVRVEFESDGKKRRSDFRPMWERAMNATRGNPNALMMLGRLVKGWGWKDEAAESWRLAARTGTGRRTALKTLFTHFESEKNTRELYHVSRDVLAMEPENPIAKNNVASLALLLGEDEPEAHRLAAENFRLSPAQPVIAATYAFSLHRQGRTAEAVAILKALPPSALSDPSIAACHGFLLAQNGDATAARPYLDAADAKKDQLFPEEAAMVADALKGLR